MYIFWGVVLFSINKKKFNTRNITAATATAKIRFIFDCIYRLRPKIIGIVVASQEEDSVLKERKTKFTLAAETRRGQFVIIQLCVLGYYVVSRFIVIKLLN
jgi:hypothetical protein